MLISSNSVSGKLFSIFLLTILLVDLSPFVLAASINVDIPAERARLNRQRQIVQQQIRTDRQLIDESSGEAREAAQQSLRAHQRQLGSINAQLERLEQLEEADSSNAGKFGGGGK